MDEVAIQDRPGIFSRLAGMFTRTEEFIEEEEPVVTNDRNTTTAGGMRLRQDYRYTVTVRRQITSFDDAMAAANGLKRGEQQILNLSATDAVTRQKIVDFMCGVNFAQEGTWEEVGEHVYLIVPSNAYVELAPPTPRMNARNN
ncbi:MAG: cell division protein SepF [Fimbriimonas sp.]